MSLASPQVFPGYALGFNASERKSAGFGSHWYGFLREYFVELAYDLLETFFVSLTSQEALLSVTHAPIHCMPYGPSSEIESAYRRRSYR